MVDESSLISNNVYTNRLASSIETREGAIAILGSSSEEDDEDNIEREET